MVPRGEQSGPELGRIPRPVRLVSGRALSRCWDEFVCSSTLAPMNMRISSAKHLYSRCFFFQFNLWARFPSRTNKNGRWQRQLTKNSKREESDEERTNAGQRKWKTLRGKCISANKGFGYRLRELEGAKGQQLFGAFELGGVCNFLNDALTNPII